MVLLKEDEQIEDLQYQNLKIIQSKQCYRFTTDAVLLANFVYGAKGKKLVELGCGSGVISTLVAAKQQPEKILAVELQPDMADMAARSVQLNCLQNKIQVICADARGINKTIGGGFDMVVVNPPYCKVGSGKIKGKDNLSICRHEIFLTLSDVFEESARLLKYSGSLFLVHRFERLSEAFCIGQKFGLTAKEIQFVLPKTNSAPNLFLARFVLGGKQGLKWKTPISVFDENGEYSVAIKQLYGESFSCWEGK